MYIKVQGFKNVNLLKFPFFITVVYDIIFDNWLF